MLSISNHQRGLLTKRPIFRTTSQFGPRLPYGILAVIDRWSHFDGCEQNLEKHGRVLDTLVWQKNVHTGLTPVRFAHSDIPYRAESPYRLTDLVTPS